MLHNTDFLIFLPPNEFRRLALSSNKPVSRPASVPTFTTDRVFLDSSQMGFTLKTDEKTMRELDEIHERAAIAAQAVHKFAWR